MSELNKKMQEMIEQKTSANNGTEDKCWITGIPDAADACEQVAIADTIRNLNRMYIYGEDIKVVINELKSLLKP